MLSFAVAAEGVTDQLAIERFVHEICGEDEAEVNFVQPTKDASDRHHAPHGGWGLVLDYCGSRAIDALATNDFLIVQLDTDRGEDFGVPLTVGGRRRDIHALIADVVAVVAARIGDPLFDQLQDRIIFAVSVHSLESWIHLLLYGLDAPNNGFARLSSRLRRDNEPALVKSVPRYRQLVSRIRRKHLRAQVGAPHSLGTFLGYLAAACQVEDEET